jgi:hypothetical protein
VFGRGGRGWWCDVASTGNVSAPNSRVITLCCGRSLAWPRQSARQLLRHHHLTASPGKKPAPVHMIIPHIHAHSSTSCLQHLQVGQGEACALCAAAARVVLINRGWLVINGGGMACSIVLVIICLLHRCIQLRALSNTLSSIRLLMNHVNNECADNASQSIVAGSPSTSRSLLVLPLYSLQIHQCAEALPWVCRLGSQTYGPRVRVPGVQA